MRLIDADKLREWLFSYYDCVNECTCKSNYNGELLMDYEVADMIADCFDNATTIDPVHAAGGCRCWECEYHNFERELCHGRTVHYCEKNNLKVSEKDFCSRGRRREEADD